MDDVHHARAREVWTDLIRRAEDLVCTNCVLVETFALVQHRLGMEAARSLQEDILPLVGVYWVSEADHRAGVTALLTAGRRQLSLVDCVSFVIMRQLNVSPRSPLVATLPPKGLRPLPGGLSTMRASSRRNPESSGAYYLPQLLLCGSLIEARVRLGAPPAQEFNELLIISEASDPREPCFFHDLSGPGEMRGRPPQRPRDESGVVGLPEGPSLTLRAASHTLLS